MSNPLIFDPVSRLIVEQGGITDVQVAAANKDGLTTVASMRTLGTGAQQAAAGDHTHTLSSLGAIGRYAATIGDGATTSIVVNHALNTRDVTVQVYQNAANYEQVECAVEHTDANNVTLVFTVAPASNAYRVVVMG